MYKFLALLLFFVVSPAVFADAPLGTLLGAVPKQKSQIENFRLLDQRGYSLEFYHLADAKSAVLLSYFVGCPTFKEQAEDLKAAQAKFSELGVQFWAINPKESDTPETIAAEMKELGLDIPVLRDDAQSISRALGFAKTCEVIICNPADWKLQWRGDLSELDGALSKITEGASAESMAEIAGCPIPYFEIQQADYLTQVAPILEEKCASCHSKSGIGPFPMSSHQKVQGWAEMMRETIRTGLMPPWHADPHYGEFANSRGLDATEKRILLAWLEAGAPWDGVGTDPLKEAYEAAVAEDWVLGEPDLTLELPFEQEIKAKGIEDYRYLTVQTNLTEDKWVSAIEVKPSNRAVVHHILIFVAYPPQYEHIQPNAKSGLGGFYAAYLPGSIIKPFPDGYAQFLPAGSSFVFQMHYNTTGKEETDLTQMALYFTDETPKMAVHVRAASETDFSIAPNDPDSQTYSDYDFRREATLLAMAPHMHFRGSRMRFTAQYPDGNEAVLLSVPNFVFDWQPMYTLSQPIQIPEGTRIFCDGAFNNSKFNPMNPNPNQWVGFGEQSFEEMFIGYIQYATPYRVEDFTPQEVHADASDSGPPLTAETLVGTKWNLYRFILEFKEDGELMINDYYKGKWSVKDENNIYVESSFRDLYLAIVNNRLSFMGRSLRQVN